ncbi:MAG TPA: HEAT repeat domain-containing protein [Planctomycetota bacterium]|nr:HEAT repeat domain-containing protein [Planctomycetota bacterium]
MIVDLVRTATDLPDRRRLAGLIAPDVDAEFTSEDAPSGPLLSGLLTQATGDVEDRLYLAAFAGQLMGGNRDLGRVLLNLMNDPDHNVRMNAAASLSELARGGALKAFLTEQAAALQELSIRDLVYSDYQVRGGALRTLAALKSESADDFILQRFEGLQSRTDSLYGLQAAMMVAPRVAARHEARLVAAILRALELPFERDIHYGLRHMAYSLSAGKREEMLRLIDLKPPDPALGAVSTSFVVSRQGRGRGMTGVTRMIPNDPLPEGSQPAYERSLR